MGIRRRNGACSMAPNARMTLSEALTIAASLKGEKQVQKTKSDLEESSNIQMRADEDRKRMQQKADDLDKKKVILEKEVKRLYCLLDRLQKETKSVAKSLSNPETDDCLVNDVMNEDMWTA
eukprot:Skav207338  [mRNA]  locus=scaffold426:59680:62011:+ [translate_table: standard]